MRKAIEDLTSGLEIGAMMGFVFGFLMAIASKVALNDSGFPQIVYEGAIMGVIIGLIVTNPLRKDGSSPWEKVFVILLLTIVGIILSAIVGGLKSAFEDNLRFLSSQAIIFGLIVGIAIGILNNVNPKQNAILLLAFSVGLFVAWWCVYTTWFGLNLGTISAGALGLTFCLISLLFSWTGNDRKTASIILSAVMTLALIWAVHEWGIAEVVHRAGEALNMIARS